MSSEEEYKWALLRVRIALGLHWDSQDNLVSVALKLRAENECLRTVISEFEARSKSDPVERAKQSERLKKYQNKIPRP